MLKYIDQNKIETEALENKAAKTMEWVKSLGQGGGSCAEHFGGYDQAPRLFFTAWMLPLPTLDEKNRTKERCAYTLYAQSHEAGYHIYTNASKELIISYRKFADESE